MKKNKIKLFHKIKPALYYLLAALFLLFEMGVQSSPSVMATPMMAEIGMNTATFGSAMGCYFLSYTLMQIPVGLLFDRLSAKYLLVGATAVCTVGAYLFHFGYCAWVLALARFLTGFGSAFAFVGVLVIADQWFSARYFAFLVGVAQWVAALGAMAGLMPLAYWVKLYGWRDASVLLSVIGAVLLIMMLVVLRSKTVASRGNSVTSLQSLRNILQNRQTYWIAVYAFTAWSPIALFAELWGVPYLIVRQHVSNEIAAQYCSVIWIGLAFMSPLLGALSDRYRKRRVFLVACSIAGLVGSLLLLYTSWGIVVLVIILLLSFGIAAAGQILCFALVRDNFPKQDLAVAIGVINMAVVVGGLLFQPAVGWVLRWHAVYAHHVGHTLGDYKVAFSVIPAVYLIGLVVGWFKIKDVTDYSN